MSAFWGLGAAPATNDAGEDSEESLIHQDSDDEEDVIRDDDVDIGFRRHQYETFEDDQGNLVRKRQRTRTRKEAKDDALYGVFNEDGGRRPRWATSTGDEAAPLFVPAAKSDTTKATTSDAGAPLFQKATKSDNVSKVPIFQKASQSDDADKAPLFQKATKSDAKPIGDSSQNDPATEMPKAAVPLSFVAASKSDDRTSQTAVAMTKEAPTTKTGAQPTNETTPQSNNEETEHTKAQESQEKADDYFRSLLEKANEKKRKRRRPPSPKTSMPSPGDPPTVSTSPGNLSMSAADYFQQQRQQEKQASAPIQKDASIAKWEKHTKGFGSKLLAKMGWTGKGGLGSNRRKIKTAASTTSSESADNMIPDTRSSVPEGTGGVLTDQAPVGSKDDAKTPSAPPRKGISRPVEVVVRPANLGLGFGNFKEMSQLQSNRQIEAEVRGLEVPEDAMTKKKRKRRTMFGEAEEDFDDEDIVAASFLGTGPTPKTVSSAMASTKDLLTQKAWKKRKNKKSAPKIIAYEDLIAQYKGDHNDSKPFIIDMTGPATSTPDSSKAKKDGEVLLGEELLHNVNFILNTHENKLHSNQQLLQSSRQRETSLNAQLNDLQDQRKQLQDRHSKLQSTLKLLDSIESHAGEYAEDPQGLTNVTASLQDLGASFSPEDRKALKFWGVLAPTLVSPILHQKLSQWDPLGPLFLTKSLLKSLFHIHVDRRGNVRQEEGLLAFRHSIIQDQLLPRIQEVLESNQWDPMDATTAVDLYELLQVLALPPEEPKNDRSNGIDPNSDQQVFPGDPAEDEDTKERSKLSNLNDIFQKELMLETIYPKLQTAIMQWKPSHGNSTGGLEQRIGLWILPWMPHLNHPSIMPTLLSECKRKLKTSLSFLQRTVGKNTDIDFIESSINVLKPWAKVLGTNVLQKLTSEYVTPYLGRYLSKRSNLRGSNKDKFRGVRLARAIHRMGLLSDVEFLSLLEGELLPTWASRMITMLLDDHTRRGQKKVAEEYLQWKREVMTQSPDQSTKLVKEDAHVCRIFYTVLRMIHISDTVNVNQDTEETLEALDPPSSNYHSVVARRSKERNSRVEDDFVRMESKSRSEATARLRLRRKQLNTPTFRDVVEEFASERGVLFQPRLGARGMVDGKQVYLFGNVPIYMDGDVVFATKGMSANWQPVSLDELDAMVVDR